MNRRGFLGAVAGALAGAVYDPERALWRPGAKLISIPSQLRVRHEFKLLAELPGRIDSLWTAGERLLALTQSGLYEIYSDGSYSRIAGSVWQRDSRFATLAIPRTLAIPSASPCASVRLREGEPTALLLRP